MLLNRDLPTRCHENSLRAFISWIAGIFNRGSNRGWADIQGKALSLFFFTCDTLFRVVVVPIQPPGS